LTVRRKAGPLSPPTQIEFLPAPADADTQRKTTLGQEVDRGQEFGGQDGRPGGMTITDRTKRMFLVNAAM
jgi:hypothetical protein